MYEQELHIRRLRPALVILNYARRANLRAIKAYHAANIKIAILDTEGGILRCEYKELVDVVEKSGCLPFIDFYFCWGKRQYDAFCRRIENGRPKVFLMGSPRFDFYHESFAACIPKPDISAESYVLVPTSFSFNNPRFATPEKEIQNMRYAIGGRPEKLRRMQRKSDQAMRGLLLSVERLAKKYPSLAFVIRPHPFENPAVYRRHFEPLSNVFVRQDGNVVQWLKHALFIIQLNSSTAVEAALLKKKTLSLELYQDPDIEVIQSSQCSIRIQSQSQLDQVVGLLLKEESDNYMVAELKKIENHLKEIKESWLNHNDGESSKRISSLVSELLQPDKAIPQKISFKLSHRRNLSVWPSYLLRRTYSKIIRPQRELRRKMKYFAAQDVAVLLDRVKAPNESFSVESHALLKKIPLFSTMAVSVKAREIH